MMFANRVAVIFAGLAISATGQFLDARPGRLLSTCNVKIPSVNLVSGVLTTSSFTSASACTTTTEGPTTTGATTTVATTTTATTGGPTTTTTTTTVTGTTTTTVTTTTTATTATTTTVNTTTVTTTTVTTTTVTTTTVTTTTTTVTTTTVNTTTVTTVTTTVTTTTVTTTVTNTTTVTTTTITTTTTTVTATTTNATTVAATTTTVTTTTVTTTTATTTTNNATTTTVTTTTVTTTVTTTTVTATTVNTTTVTTTTVTTTTVTTTTVTTTTVTTTTVTTTIITTTTMGTTTKGCATTACTSTGYTTATCNAIAAGASKTDCVRVTGDALVTACLPATISVSCPTGNNKAVAPDFAQANGLTCKACGVSAIVVDKNPVAGKYFLVLTFGDLVSTDGTIWANSVNEYEVFWTNSVGRPMKMGMAMAKVATVKALKGTCCDSMKYKVALIGNFSTGYGNDYRLAIRAKSNNKHFLPFFAYTSPIEDSTTGQVNKFVGSFTLTMSAAHATALANDPRAKKAFTKAFAATVGVNVDEVIIKAIYLNNVKISMRRLQEARRLADSIVKVDYIVMTADTGKTIASINIANLKKNVQKEAKAIGHTVVVKSATAANPTTTTEGTPSATASASALMFHMMAVFIAACAHFLL